MANVLKPDLMWIEGRCYRINDCKIEIGSFQEHDLYENGLFNILNTLKYDIYHTYIYCHIYLSLPQNSRD